MLRRVGVLQCASAPQPFLVASSLAALSTHVCGARWTPSELEVSSAGAVIPRAAARHSPSRRGRVLAPTQPLLMFRTTPPALIFAHWFAGKHKKHRYAREKRYHPKFDVARQGHNQFSRKLHWKTNRWNYQQAYRDMP